LGPRAYLDVLILFRKISHMLDVLIGCALLGVQTTEAHQIDEGPRIHLEREAKSGHIITGIK
jgi:hypothetical protein